MSRLDDVGQHAGVRAARMGALVISLLGFLTGSVWAQSAPGVAAVALNASGAAPTRAAVAASGAGSAAKAPAATKPSDSASASTSALASASASAPVSASPGESASASTSASASATASAPEASASALADLNATSRTFPRAESNLTQLGWTLLGVAAAFIAAAWWLRWRRQQSLPASEGPALEVVRSVALSGRDRLHLVKAGEQYLVVGHTASQITLLSEVAVPTSKREAAPTQPPSWNEAQDSMNAFFKQVEQTKISSA